MRRYTPAYDAPADRYLEILDSYDIELGVLVQPSFLGTDNSFLLDALAEHPGRLRAVVVVDQEQPDVEALLVPERQWAELADQLSAWPGSVVIDHLGLPAAGDSGVVTRLAELDHVWVKLSAPYRSSPALATERANDILDATAGQRMIFGSDWPFTRHERSENYGAQLAWARHAVGDHLFDEGLPMNARRLLGLDPDELA